MQCSVSVTENTFSKASGQQQCWPQNVPVQLQELIAPEGSPSVEPLTAAAHGAPPHCGAAVRWEGALPWPASEPVPGQDGLT